MGMWGWWAFDIFTLVASYLSADALSAQTIMRSMGLLTFMVPVGFASGTALLLGNQIGKGCSMSLLHYYKVSTSVSFALGLAQVILLWALMEPIIHMFTSVEGVQDQIRAAWWVFMIFVIFDTTQGICSSAIRASGKQKQGAIVTFLAYFILGIPLTLVSVFAWN